MHCKNLNSITKKTLGLSLIFLCLAVMVFSIRTLRTTANYNNHSPYRTSVKVHTFSLGENQYGRVYTTRTFGPSYRFHFQYFTDPDVAIYLFLMTTSNYENWSQDKPHNKTVLSFSAQSQGIVNITTTDYWSVIAANNDTTTTKVTLIVEFRSKSSSNSGFFSMLWYLFLNGGFLIVLIVLVSVISYFIGKRMKQKSSGSRTSRFGSGHSRTIISRTKLGPSGSRRSKPSPQDINVTCQFCGHKYKGRPRNYCENCLANYVQK